VEIDIFTGNEIIIMSKNQKRKHPKTSLLTAILNASSFLLIPIIIFTIPAFISSSLNKNTITKKISPLSNPHRKILKQEISYQHIQSRYQGNVQSSHLELTVVAQSESQPTPTADQSKKNKPTKTPKPTSTPIPTPPPSNPSTNNLMAFFGILIVLVIILGIWVNWRKVFR
jgi:hypothetical protein